MLKYLEWLDLYILRFINLNFGGEYADPFWLTITQLHKQSWFLFGIAPLVLIGLISIYRAHAVKIVLGVGLAVAFADTAAYRGIKSAVHRPRPFQNERLVWLRHSGIAQGSSFPSNHAANIWAGAVTLSWFIPSGRLLFYIFAGIVAVSRVALGVHYPSDVLAGAILGICVGFLIRILVLSRFKCFRLPNRNNSEAVSSSVHSLRNRRH